jgi:integrase/recombinase XerD
MLPRQLKPLYKRLIGTRPKEAYVFPREDGKQWSFHSFDRAFHRHLKACGLNRPGITPHTLRHSFATHMIRNNVSIAVVKAMLGHEDIKSTMMYVQVDHADVRKAMDRYILNRDDRKPDEDNQGKTDKSRGEDDDNQDVVK